MMCMCWHVLFWQYQNKIAISPLRQIFPLYDIYITLISMFQVLHAQMETHVWLEEVILKDGWKYVIMVYGEQYVMMDGTMMMPE